MKDQDDGRLLEEGDILILEKGEGRDKWSGGKAQEGKNSKRCQQYMWGNDGAEGDKIKNEFS